MRILLDECVDERLRFSFEGHECHSARYAGFKGLENGALLAAAEAAGYEAIITTDQGMRHQQNLEAQAICVVVLCAPTNRILMWGGSCLWPSKHSSQSGRVK